MGAVYQHHGAWFWRAYSSVNVQNGAVIIDDGTGEPLRENGRLAVKSLARSTDGAPRFKRLVTKNGKPLRIQQTVKLADIDETHKTATSLAVLLLATRKDEEIKAWEAEAGTTNEEQRPNGAMSVAEFFETVFLPYVEAEKEASTARSYKNYWNAYLEDHFNHSKTLAKYEPFQGTNLLEALCKEYSENTVMHVRALASAIFSYACAKGYIKYNPWRDVKKTAAGQDVEDGYAYTAPEVEQIIEALEHVSGARRLFCEDGWNGCDNRLSSWIAAK